MAEPGRAGPGDNRHPMKLDPISLRLFVAVMEESAIARAAAREHIAPSAASRRLAELESQLQVELFTRSNRGSVPTAAAYALLNMARGVLNDLDGIGEQMREYGSGLRGHVRVMANISAITQFLPSQLQRFLDQHPHVDVRLQERVSSDIARAVADNEADIGILNQGSYGEKIRLRPYRRDRLIVIVPRAMRWYGGARFGWPRCWTMTWWACTPAARSTTRSRVPRPTWVCSPGCA